MRDLGWACSALFTVLSLGGCNQAASGEAGMPGAMGLKGDKGERGDKGEKGDPGSKGDIGPQGAAGATGPAGPAGTKGETGPAGPTGPAGMAGPAGTVGPAGPAGATGATGAIGATGPKGDPGPQGPAGPTGSGAYSEDLGGFAGFTGATYTGALTGGRPGAHAICAAAFAGSHFCHAAEYIQSTSAATIPSSGAWIDPSTNDSSGTTNAGMPGSGRWLYGSSCNAWSDGSSSYSGYYVTQSGSITNSGDCTVSRPLACCNSPSKTRFAGFTSTSTNGNVGSRPKMHAACAAEFAGAHLCHAAEYVRATSPTLVPSSGAWIDPSTSNGTGTSNAGMPGSGRWLYGSSCNAWTDGSSSYSGYYVTQSGSITNSGDCSVSRRVACCI